MTALHRAVMGLRGLHNEITRAVTFHALGGACFIARAELIADDGTAQA
jgi:hypothetical protein